MIDWFFISGGVVGIILGVLFVLAFLRSMLEGSDQ